MEVQPARPAQTGPAKKPRSEPRPRNPEATQKRILKAAKAEFAKFGLGGARVDRIAQRATANKRMIYHYFGSKEDLFRAVLEEAYSDIRAAEKKLRLESLEPEEAIERLVSFTWDYYLKHPEFLTFVNSENLHKARHVNNSELIRQMHKPYVAMVQAIIDRGIAKGVFRAGIDAVDLNITIAALGYYYLTNRFTGAIIYDTDLMAPARLESRLRFNLDTINRLLRSEPHPSP